MLAQLPIEEAIKTAGTVIDTALVTSPNHGNGYGLALATPYIFLFVISSLFIYWMHIRRKDEKSEKDRKESEKKQFAIEKKAEKEEAEKKRLEEIQEKRTAFKNLREDVNSIGNKFEQRTKSLEDALREDSTAIRGILADHNTRIAILESRIGKDPAA